MLGNLLCSLNLSELYYTIVSPGVDIAELYVTFSTFNVLCAIGEVSLLLLSCMDDFVVYAITQLFSGIYLVLASFFGKLSNLAEALGLESLGFILWQKNMYASAVLDIYATFSVAMLNTAVQALRDVFCSNETAGARKLVRAIFFDLYFDFIVSSKSFFKSFFSFYITANLVTVLGLKALALDLSFKNFYSSLTRIYPTNVASASKNALFLVPVTSDWA